MIAKRMSLMTTSNRKTESQLSLKPKVEEVDVKLPSSRLLLLRVKKRMKRRRKKRMGSLGKSTVTNAKMVATSCAVKTVLKWLTTSVLA